MNINLLPREEYLRHIDKQAIIKKALAILLNIVAVIVICYITFIGVLKTQQSKLGKLQQTHQEYNDLKKEISAIQGEIDRIDLENQMLITFFTQNLFWSDKLTQFAKIIPDEVWLESLDISADKTRKDLSSLKLKGNLFALSSSDGPIVILNEFIKSLKNSNEFFKDFRDVTLIDMTVGSFESRQVIKFNIELPVKENM